MQKLASEVIGDCSVLVCDCPEGFPCHGEVLAAFISRCRVAAAALAVSVPARQPRHFSVTSTLEFNLDLAWSQAVVDRTLRKFFPDEWLRHVKMPNVEDLVNRSELRAWRDWSAKHQVQADQNFPSWNRSGWFAIAAGTQRGAMHSKHQVQPLDAEPSP